MIETFTEFDPAEYLSTPEVIEEFMRDTLETGDANYIAKAMEVVTRARRRTINSAQNTPLTIIQTTENNKI